MFKSAYKLHQGRPLSLAKNLLNSAPDGALKKNLPQLFKSYPNLSSGMPSSYFLWSDEPPVTADFFTKVCHADMNMLSPGFDHLVTACPKSDEISLAYQQMLIHGPFRALSDLIGLHKVGDNYYLLCSELGKWPANVLYNFCIASRVPLEYPDYLPYWAELVQAGYDQTLAFLLSYSVRGDSSQKYRDFPRQNHLWVDPASNWRNILTGEMVKMAPSFKDYPKGCNPCNVIWGNWIDYGKISSMSAEEVSAYLELKIEVPAAPPPPVPKFKKNKYDAFVVAQALHAQIAHNEAHFAEAAQAQPVAGNNPFLHANAAAQAGQWQWGAVAAQPVPAQAPPPPFDFDEPIFDDEDDLEDEDHFDEDDDDEEIDF